MAGILGQCQSVRREAGFGRAGARFDEQIIPGHAIVRGRLHARRFIAGGITQLARKADRGVGGWQEDFVELEKL